LLITRPWKGSKLRSISRFGAQKSSATKISGSSNFTKVLPYLQSAVQHPAQSRHNGVMKARGAKPMLTSDVHRRNKIADNIRRMASSPNTRRYVAALPQFEVDPDIPADMAAMLKRLAKAEKRSR
jgi:hypothetical protein